MALKAAGGMHTRVADGRHLEHLLDEAASAIERGELPLAITHLAQSSYVAATKGTDLSQHELLQRVKRLIDAGGGLA